MSYSLFQDNNNNSLDNQLKDFLFRFGNKFISREDYRSVYGKKLFTCNLLLPNSPQLEMYFIRYNT